ncbi:MAG: hypothetical protein LBN07_04595 [Christensenellaceae bacterium]|jgi:hypothetical protein|nr:hypothetical protein [Christensenellaceae bacterium]
MKKFSTILAVSAVFLLCAFTLAACTSEDRITATETKEAYEGAGFTVSEIVSETNFEGLEKVFLITKGSDSVKAYVFADTASNSVASNTIRGNGLSQGCQNVCLGKFVIGGVPVVVDVFDSNSYGLTSPEIVALTKPLTDLWAEKNK